MVSKQHVLLIDVGNTRIKYLLLSQVNADCEPHVVTHGGELTQLVQQIKPSHIYLSSVGDAAALMPLNEYCAKNDINLRQIEAEKNAFGVTNAYETVSRMGADRWLAILGAHKMTSKPFAVIHIGTAITCDFVINNVHEGGWIAPGFHIMRDALIARTKKVFANNETPDELMSGNNTEACVNFGCLAAVQGVYLSAIAHISSKRTDFDVIIGGGDKNMLAFSESNGSILSANLVVHGLARYAESELFA